MAGRHVLVTKTATSFENRWSKGTKSTKCRTHLCGVRDLKKFSRRWRFKSWSSGLWHRVVIW